MLQRYRVWGAVLALGEFTVSELSALSQVRESTVRTTLRRGCDYVERVGTAPTGRRGGQRNTWRLRAEAREPLRAKLRDLEQQGVGPWLGDREAYNRTLPAGIIAAEDVLIRLIPAAADPKERAELVKLAQTQFEVGLASAPATAEPGGPVERHRRVVETLLKLERAERLSNKLVAHQDWKDLLLSAMVVEGDPLAEAVRLRFTQSPIGAPPTPRPSRTGRALFTDTARSDARMASEIRRLQQRVRDLEAELIRLQEENDALMVELGHEDVLYPSSEVERVEVSTRTESRV